MRDDFLSADWSTHHRIFSNAVASLREVIATSLDRIYAEQFGAPWRHEGKRR